MRPAPSERLRDLAAVAIAIADAIDADRDCRLPFLAIARGAVIADKAAAELTGVLVMLKPNVVPGDPQPTEGRRS